MPLGIVPRLKESDCRLFQLTTELVPFQEIYKNGSCPTLGIAIVSL